MITLEFIEKMAPLVMKEAYRKGYHFPSAVLAQALLESGEGTAYRSQLCDVHNYFSIKAGSSWNGATKTILADEYENGKWKKVPSVFRAYSSMEDAVKDYFSFISAERYANLKKVGSPAAYLYNIVLDGYATDPTYYNKAMERLTINTLDRYDIPDQIIRGLWGNGLDRTLMLNGAGYNAGEMQNYVNMILGLY